MLTVIGAVCLAGGCAAIGFLAVGRLNSRVRVLSEWIQAIELFQTEISFSLKPLPEIIKEIRLPSLRPFFDRLEKLWNPWGDKTYHEVWSDAAGVLDLPQSDLSLVAELGVVLGRYDAELQGMNLTYIRKRLEHSLAAQREQRARMGRIYGVLGVVGGVTLVLILI